MLFVAAFRLEGEKPPRNKDFLPLYRVSPVMIYKHGQSASFSLQHSGDQAPRLPLPARPDFAD